MSWDIFSLLYNLVATPLLASVDAMMAAMTNYIAPVLRWGLIAFVTMRLLWKMFDHDAEPLGELVQTLLLGAVALYMVASVANYGPWARDVLLNGLPREVGQALAGSLGARPLTGVVFGEIWSKAFVAGVAVLKNIPWSMAGFGLVGCVLVFWIVSLLATILAFAIWMKAFVFLALLVGVGPLFAGLWVFPLTRNMATGWFHATMAAIVLQILVVALLSLLLASVTQLLAQMASAPEVMRGNEIVQIRTLLSGLVLFLTAGWLSYQLPGLASSITGGFAGYAGSATRRVRGMMGSAMSGYNNATSSTAPTQHVRSVQVPVRSMPIPGRSMSN